MIDPHTRPPAWTPASMEDRVVRYGNLRPCMNAFIDTRSPGSEAKENFTIIGPGVSENPEQFVHIAEPHGFNVGGARQPPGCVNSQHSHNTAEVFVVHTGEWRFDLGERGDDAQVHIGPGGVISIPTKTFRGFTNVGTEAGFLFAVLGHDDPGRVLWAPEVFDMAQEHGLVLLETGQLIDTIAGQTVPADARPMPVTSQEQIAALTRVTQQEAERFVWRNDTPVGTQLTPIIGAAGPLDCGNGFDLHRIDIAAGETMEPRAPAAPEVVFVHSGRLDVCWPDGAIRLEPGDTMTVPIGLDRRFSSDAGCVAYIVRR